MQAKSNMRTLTIVAGLGLAVAATAVASSAEPTPSPDGSEALQVIVGPGGTGLEPMAVPDARCEGGAPAEVCKMVAETLRRDMTLSFMFQVQPKRSYLVDPATEPLAEPSWNDWNNIGARWLVKSEVTGPAGGPWDAELRLFNVVDKSAVQVRGQSVKNLDEGGLRKAVHQFANGILEARTGVPGVFDTRIAYSVKAALGVKSIGVVSMDGVEKSGLVNNGSINTLPTWGFGGVLYTSFIDGRPEIFFGKRKLSRDDGHYRKVAVGPGGKMVASISYGGQSDLFLLSQDGTVLKNLTNTPADEVAPTFSPDGSKIAFVSSQAGTPQIYVMGSEGGGMSRLTHAGGYNYSPDWGKNGLIVFAGMDDAQSDIFSVSEAGEIRRLTQDQGFNKDPTWSPDGRYVAFVSSRAEGAGIYLMSADGRYQIMVTKGGGYGNLAWER
ncbi:MAG: PD40 domain-containing protein [Deltaproteobacteria bacterium]|nr:PD40 domain-containing protein [Deltaproteobacteria bacterium]